MPYEPARREEGHAPRAQDPRRRARASPRAALHPDAVLTRRRRFAASRERYEPRETHGGDGSGSGEHRPGRTRGGMRSRLTTSSERLGVDPATGLAASTAAELLQTDGPNALPAEAGVPGWRRFLEQYAAYMQIILLIAAIVSFAIGEWSTGALLLLLTVCQRRRRPPAGGQGRERHERLEVVDEADRTRPPRRSRVVDPGRGGRPRRRRADHRGRQRGRRRTDHPGELARHR